MLVDKVSWRHTAKCPTWQEATVKVLWTSVPCAEGVTSPGAESWASGLCRHRMCPDVWDPVCRWCDNRGKGDIMDTQPKSAFICTRVVVWKDSGGQLGGQTVGGLLTRLSRPPSLPTALDHGLAWPRGTVWLSCPRAVVGRGLFTWSPEGPCKASLGGTSSRSGCGG